MINQKYALKPETQLDPLELMLILDKFGLSEGRFLSRLPDNWRPKIIEEFEKRNLGEIEVTRIKRSLQRLKERGGILDLPIAYKEELNWLNNALKAKSEGHIDDIISDPTDHVISVKDIIENNSLSACRDTKIYWTAEEMVRVAKPLLSLSEEVYIVDRYIQLRSGDPDGYFRFFKTIIETTQGKKIKFIIYCTKEHFEKTDSKKNFKKKIAPQLSSNQSIEFFILSNQTTLHERFIMSLKGGIYYDKGFQSSIDPQERHMVGYYSSSAFEQQWRDFVVNRDNLKIEDSFTMVHET